MKKKISILLAGIMAAVMLMGCGGTTVTPTSVVNDYFKEMKKSAESDLAKELLGAQYSEEVPKEAVDAVVDMLAKLEVTPTSEQINGEAATVNVKVKGVSFENVITNVFTEVLTLYMSNPNATDAEIEQLTMTAMVNAIKNTEATEREGVINLKKSGDTWEVVDDDSLQKVILGMSDADMDSAFE